MNIRGAEVFPGQPCPYSTGNGCSDYENRPQDPCRNFLCGWAMPESPLPEWMKPNNAKVIVIFNKLSWRGLAVDLAVPIGRRIPPRALAWLKQFAMQNNRPLLYAEQIVQDGKFQRDQQIFCHGPQEFQTDIRQRLDANLKLW